MFFDDLAVYEGFGGIVLARDEGLRIAEALGPVKKNVILQNHGCVPHVVFLPHETAPPDICPPRILTCGKTMGEAAAFFIALERACQAQLLVEAAAANGIPKRFVGDDEARYTKDCSGSPACMYMQFLPEYNAVVHETRGSFL